MDRMAIEVSAVAAMLDFSENSQNGIYCITYCPLGLKLSSISLYDRRFSRYRQSKFRASDNSGFSWRTSQNIQNGFWAVAYALWVEIELRFALRSTVSEITAIEVSAVAANLDFFQNISKWPKIKTFWAVGVEIELLFALRSTVFEISAIEFSGEW